MRPFDVKDICNCEPHQRRVFYAHTETDEFEPLELCIDCGRIHQMPKGLKLRDQHEPQTPHDWVQTALISEQRNLQMLKTLHAEWLAEDTDELETVRQRIAQFRRQYPEPPKGTPSAHYRQALETYKQDLRRALELEESIHLLMETLALLEAEDDPDPEGYERIRQTAGLEPLRLFSSPSQNLLQSSSSSSEEVNESGSERREERLRETEEEEGEPEEEGEEEEGEAEPESESSESESDSGSISDSNSRLG